MAQIRREFPFEVASERPDVPLPIFGHLRNNPSRLIVALGVSALVFADLVLLWALDIFELTELKTLAHRFTGINRSDPVFSGGLEHKRRRENEVPVRSRLDQNLEFEADRLGAECLLARRLRPERRAAIPADASVAWGNEMDSVLESTHPY